MWMQNKALAAGGGAAEAQQGTVPLRGLEQRIANLELARSKKHVSKLVADQVAQRAQAQADRPKALEVRMHARLEEASRAQREQLAKIKLLELRIRELEAAPAVQREAVVADVEEPESGVQGGDRSAWLATSALFGFDMVMLASSGSYPGAMGMGLCCLMMFMLARRG